MNFSKLMGAMLIISCGLIIGLSRNRRRRTRLYMLEDFEGFLRNLLLRIEFSGEALTEIIRNDNSVFASNVRRYMDVGHDLPDSWKLASEEFAEIQDQVFVMDVLENFGTAGIDEEREKAQNNLMLCREMLNSAKENLLKKGRSEAVIPLYISAIIALVML